MNCGNWAEGLIWPELDGFSIKQAPKNQNRLKDLKLKSDRQMKEQTELRS
jgi:hypothetical protein